MPIVRRVVATGRPTKAWERFMDSLREPMNLSRERERGKPRFPSLNLLSFQARSSQVLLGASACVIAAGEPCSGAAGELVELEIDDRRGEEGQHLAHEEAADHGHA